MLQAYIKLKHFFNISDSFQKPTIKVSCLHSISYGDFEIVHSKTNNLIDDDNDGGGGDDGNIKNDTSFPFL